MKSVYRRTTIQLAERSGYAPVDDKKRYIDPSRLLRMSVMVSVGQIYENAKRKDSSCMEAQIIVNDNAKDKKMIKPQIIMLHYRKETVQTL